MAKGGRGRALGEEAKGRGAAVDNMQCSQMAVEGRGNADGDA